MHRRYAVGGAVVILLVGFLSGADAEPRTTYVGDGRYACSGSVRECEPVQRRNEALEEQRRQSRELEQQRRELEKQTELMKAERARAGNGSSR